MTAGVADTQKFIKGKRYPWTYWGVSSARRRDWPKAGIKANFHDLRRTGAEYMRAAGVPIDVYSKQLGHSDIKTTQIYRAICRPNSWPARRSSATRGLRP